MNRICLLNTSEVPRSMKRLKVLTVTLLVICGFGSSHLEAQPEGLAIRISEARKANAALMKQYSWQSRAELIDKGKVADTRIDMVSYGADGQLQRSLLNDEASPLPRGFLRRRLAEKEKERTEKYLKGLRALLDQYTLPTEGKAFDFASEAKIEAPDANGVLQLTGSSVVVPGDALSLSVQATTRQTRKVAITTTYEGDAVTATASFKTLPSGLTHLEFGEVDVPAKEIKLQLHNFNFNQNN
jgi:hypothetical protein